MWICQKRKCSKHVLIDTWWNVNADKSPLAMASVTVLIDTWWNVNKFVYYKLCNTRFVLIDTWWNVNFYGRVDIISAYRF